MIAGVKEGGYAALNAALSVPGQYHMAASYSCGSLTDETFDPELDKQLDNAFGTTDLRTLNGTDKGSENADPNSQRAQYGPFFRVF